MGWGSQRASGMIGKVGGGGLPAAKLQSPGCHLHYLTFHPLETPSCYCSSLNCFLLIKKVTKQKDITKVMIREHII